MKRPDYREWNKQVNFYLNDKQALSEHYEVTLTTVYNWLHFFEDEERGMLDTSISENVDSDVEEPVLLSHKEYVRLQKESPNKPHLREATIRVPESCLVLMLADYHCGSIYSDSEMAEEIKNICATHKNVFAWFNGDLLDYEGAGPPDIKFDQAFAHPNTTRAMAEAWIKEFNGSMLLMLSGCHDNWTYKWTGETFMERLTKYIPTNAVFHDSIMLNFIVGDITYRGHVAHKAGKGNSRYNPSHGGFQELREDFDGDFVIGAHSHHPGVAMQVIRGNSCMVVNCDSFKTIDFFSNKTYLPKPVHIGAVYFDAKEKRMVPFFDWSDGLCYIQKLESQQKNMDQSQ